jgi:hypothetical protein
VTEPSITVAVVWSDVDLLEVELRVRFDVWCGAERAYVTRKELAAFATALDEVAEGGDQATLSIGQPDLGYGTCRVFEYGGPRHLAAEIIVGNAGGRVINRPDYPRELRVSVPIERGQLPAFARAIRNAVAAEQGIARLPVPADWPW